MQFGLIETWFKMKTNILVLKSEGRYFECAFDLPCTKQFLKMTLHLKKKNGLQNTFSSFSLYYQYQLQLL